ncbi:MAG: hypothetical protein ACYDHX_16425 [Methanothrix sp.]
MDPKNPTAQVNELFAIIVAYNPTVVIHEMYENGNNPDFLQLKSDVCKSNYGSAPRSRAAGYSK